MKGYLSPGVSSRSQRTRTQEMKLNPAGLLKTRVSTESHLKEGSH